MHPAGAEGFWRGRGLTILGGALVVVLPFLANWLLWYPAPADRLWLGGDFVEHFAQRAYAYRALAEGRLPLWDPFRETGLPVASYLFDLFNPALLPLAFLLEDGYLRCDVAQLFMVAHLAIGGLGGYLWGLSLNLGRTAACLMGLVLGLNGFLLVKTWGHDLVLHTMAWAPYVFLFLDRARRRASALAGAWAGFFLALVFLGGHPQFFYYVALALAAHFVYWGVGLSRERGPARAWPLIGRMYLPLGLAALLLASPQILHLASTLGSQLTPVLPAGDRTDLIFTQRGSGDPRQLLFLLLPTLADGGSESLVYVGLLPLMLAGLAFHFRKDPESGFFKLLLGLAFLLSLGGSLGLHKVLLDLLPGYAYFRETGVLGAGHAGPGRPGRLRHRLALFPQAARGLAAAARGAGGWPPSWRSWLTRSWWPGGAGCCARGRKTWPTPSRGPLLAASGLCCSAGRGKTAGERLAAPFGGGGGPVPGFFSSPDRPRTQGLSPDPPGERRGRAEAGAWPAAAATLGFPSRRARSASPSTPGGPDHGRDAPHEERALPPAYWEISWHPRRTPATWTSWACATWRRAAAPEQPPQDGGGGNSPAACRLPPAGGGDSPEPPAPASPRASPPARPWRTGPGGEGRTLPAFPCVWARSWGPRGWATARPAGPGRRASDRLPLPRAWSGWRTSRERPAAADRRCWSRRNGLRRNQGPAPQPLVSRAAVIGPGASTWPPGLPGPFPLLLFREPAGLRSAGGVAAGPGGPDGGVAFAPERVVAKVTAAEPAGWS